MDKKEIIQKLESIQYNLVAIRDSSEEVYTQDDLQSEIEDLDILLESLQS